MKQGKAVQNNYSIVGVVVAMSIVFGLILMGISWYATSKLTSGTKVKVDDRVGVECTTVYTAKTVEQEVVSADNSNGVDDTKGVEKEEVEVDIKEELNKKVESYKGCMQCDKGYNLIKRDIPLEKKMAYDKKVAASKVPMNALKNIGSKNVKVELVVPAPRVVETTMRSVNAARVAKTKKVVAKTTVKKNKKVASANKVTTNNNIMYLACIVFAEAGGESYNGKLAVANVVLNRVKSGKYPNSIYGVISQRGQFGPFRNGSLNRAISKFKGGYFTSGKNNGYTASLKAAQAALNGQNNIGNRYSFNTSGPAKALRIGAHKFW